MCGRVVKRIAGAVGGFVLGGPAGALTGYQAARGLEHASTARKEQERDVRMADEQVAAANAERQAATAAGIKQKAAETAKAEAERQAALTKASREAGITAAFAKKSRSKNSLFTGGGEGASLGGSAAAGRSSLGV